LWGCAPTRTPSDGGSGISTTDFSISFMRGPRCPLFHGGCANGDSRYLEAGRTRARPLERLNIVSYFGSALMRVGKDPLAVSTGHLGARSRGLCQTTFHKPNPQSRVAAANR
jgi:hypothetical protein